MRTGIVQRLIVSGLVLTVMACASAQPTATATPPTATPTEAAAAASPTVAPKPSPSNDTTVADGEAWIAAQGTGTIRLIRPDGTGDHVPFPLAPGGEQLHPDWSPDGQRLSFTTRGETDVIWIGNVDGTGTKLVVDCQAPCAWADEAAWSPDGNSLIYQRMSSKGGTGVSTLEVLDLASGKAHVVITAPEGRAFYQPRWSPDGTKVVTEFVKMAGHAFDSDVVGVALAIVDVTAAKPVATEITKAADLTNSPDWSWATDTIVFAQPNTPAGFEGPSDLVTMQPDGSDRTVVLSVGARGGQTPQPAWSVDGSRIIFVQPDSSMATVAADGSDPAPAVATGHGQGLHPRYRPVL